MTLFPRSRRAVTAVVLAIVVAFSATTAVLPARAAPAEPLIVLDVRPFVAAQTTTKRTYDYLKVLTAIQGLVNRTAPRLYLIGQSSNIADQHNFQADEFWLGQLRAAGGVLNQRKLERTTDVIGVIDQLARRFPGVAVWDPKVPSTANVVSTAAGVESLLPVRYDPSEDSPYSHLINDLKLPVRLNLVDRFTGTGTIWGTTLPSTGSAKNDAYLWAKRRWLDTGRTNHKLMEYAPDGMSQTANSSSVGSISLPTALQTGQQMAVSVTIKNTGGDTWTRASLDRLGSQPANGFVWSDLNGGFSNSLTDQRVFLDSDASIAPGQSATFTLTITAPDTPGSYSFDAQLVRDGVRWYAGTNVTVPIEVTSAPQSTEPPEPRAYAPQVGYPDLFDSLVYNADYYIAKKAFFFDLSPDATTVPNDDPSQPVGTDTQTMTKLFRQQYDLADGQIFTIGGFPPWWLKYTTYVDPHAGLDPVGSEWKFADIASSYGGQMDADAAGIAGLLNASVYTQQRLSDHFKQKAATRPSGETRVPGRKYVTFYMGDYDAASWTAGTLPAFWNDPARGSLPLAWAPDTALSARIPQVFNYLYATQTSNDVFVGGDNGAGYLNPERLLAANRPDGLPDGLATWTRYTANLYKRFDVSLTGFLIAGNSGSTSLPVQKAFATFSPGGVGTNSGFAEPIVDGTPFMHVVGSPGDVNNAASYGEGLAGLLRGRSDNIMIRNVLASPTVLRDAVAYVHSHYPDLDFEVVDPYTNMAFYAEAKPWETNKAPTYPMAHAATAPTVDGVAQAGEWDSATQLDVSTQDPTIVAWGAVWGSIADTFATHYRLEWDDSYLYLYEDRHQDDIAFSSSGGDIWGSSASAMFIAPQDSSSVTDYTIVASPSSPSGDPQILLRTRGPGGSSFVPLEGAKFGSVINDDGYTMELAVPWSQLPELQPGDAGTWQFTALATVNDTAGTWGQVMWVGNGDDSSQWGHLSLTPQ